MLPTKGYFQDIECPYLETGCGRPYCHFRHRKKLNEENINEPDKDDIPTVPTYKPTPKSELANINKSHIPISYVPDLAFRPDRTTRPIPKFDKPTYKPTPLSILSSASKSTTTYLEENGDNDAIKEIKENLASNEYNPLLSLNNEPIDFEELNTEFQLIGELLSDSEEQSNKVGPGVRTDESQKVTPQNEDLKGTSNKKIVKSDTSDKHSEKSHKHSSSDHGKSSDKHRSKSSSHKKEKGKDSEKTKEKEEKFKEKDEKSKDKDDKSKDRHSRHEKSCKVNSSRDKHKSDEKKDCKDKEKHSSHKDKHKSHDKSSEKSRDKSERSSDHRDHRDHRDRDKKREKSSSSKHDKSKHDKERNHDNEKSKSKNNSSKKCTTTEQKKNEESDEDNVPELEGFQMDDIELDEDETMMECYKIFSEYKPEPVTTKLPSPPPQPSGDVDLEEIFTGKKRVAHSNAESSITQSKTLSTSKPKNVLTPGQMLLDRFKIARSMQANREQENLMTEVKQPTTLKRPAPTLLEAARQHKIKKLKAHNAGPSTSLVDDIINGTASATPTVKPVVSRKIAPVQNFQSYQKAKERVEIAKQKTVNVAHKTVAQTQKSGRVAHVPDFNLSNIPDVLHADKSKLPVNVRTRFLTMLADECVKLYLTKDSAYQRALNEEYSCYEKCKVVATYRNSAMLAVNRLRKEVQEREKTGLGPIDGDGDTGASGSEFSGKRFYNNVKKWLLSEEELDIHGYPRESSHPGRAYIKNRRDTVDTSLDGNQRRCARCGKIYAVDDDGWPLFDEECMYHPLRKRTIRGEQTYLCCRVTDDAGCVTSDTHVSESVNNFELEGYMTTMDPEEENDPRSFAVYALDCEMCYTTKGLELTRVTIIDTECKTVYESLVKPLNPIIDYNTRFSGITKDQMDRTSTSILQIQANILHLCNSKTILVGHSLESDMKALKIVHSTIIDTAVLFPHKMGLPHKRALKALASEYLRKIIQNDVGGHDSAEDAVTCMELIKWKLREELKTRGK